MKRISGLIAVLLITPNGLLASVVQGTHGLYLRTGPVDTSASRGLVDEAIVIDPADRYVIQLDGPMTPQRRQQLEAAGIDVGAYLPIHAYVVKLNADSFEAAATLNFVRWLGAFQPEWKIDSAIGSKVFTTSYRQDLQAQGIVELIVSLFAEIDADTIIPDLVESGIEVLHKNHVNGHDILHVQMQAAHVANLGTNHAIQFVEEAPELTPRNDTNEWIVQSNTADLTPAWDHGILGEGQIGGLIDWPVNVEHCSFEDEVPIGPDHRKVVAYRGAAGSDTHGTHVAGSFVGDSGTWGSPDFRDGIALAAKVSYSSAPDIYFDPSSFYDRLLDAHDDGARVHSNSWGDDGTTSYMTWCEQIDAFSRDFEDSLVAFAITNLSTLKAPENAKNVLAVGASKDTPTQHEHCTGGAGPTFDGRRKPEIYAPGCSTQSSSQSTSCSWLGFTGTSMAAPVISGSGLLIREYFEDGFYPSGTAVAEDARTPTGALTKAMLINAAVDLTGVEGYPSDLEGWGRLLLDGSLHFAEELRTLFVVDVRNVDGLSTGESVVYSVDVTDDSEPLRMTLVWTDVPATVGTDYAPINNLDLVVQSPSGSTYLGNYFKSGESTTGGTADPVNNVEQVQRLTPELGTYLIEVDATEVNDETQGFALVVTGAITFASASCDGDANGDNVVDPLDSGYVLSRFGCTVGAGDPACDAADANGDGVVDPLDVGYVLSRFGDCTP